MRRILVLVNSLAMGGAERVSLTVSQSLKDLGCEVDMLVLEPNKKCYETSNFTFNIYTLPRIARPLGYIYRLKARQVRRHLKADNVRYDLVLSNLFMSDSVAKYLGFENMYHCIHNSLTQSIRLQRGYPIGISLLKRFLIYKIFAKKVYNNSQIITVSNGVKINFLSSGYEPKSIATIFNPFDIEKIRQLSIEYVPSVSGYIVHVGRFDRQKRHDVLLRAYKNSGIKVPLILVGDHDTEVGCKTKKLVKELGLEKHVVFKGLIQNPYPLIKNAKCLVLSSDFEGLPTVIVEAIALKTPVISTDCESGPREILLGNFAQGLVPTGDVDALARKMQDIPVIEEAEYDKLICLFDKHNIAKKYLELAEKKV